MRKQLQGSKAIPRKRTVQADTLQSGGIDNAGEISQGLFKGTKKLKVLGSFKKGGDVKKTGIYKLHKGEQVVAAKKKFNAAAYSRARTNHFGIK